MKRRLVMLTNYDLGLMKNIKLEVMDESKQEKVELKETSVECQATEEEYDIIFVVSNNENGPTVLQKYQCAENNEGYHICKVCGEQFVKSDALQEHIASHIEEVYICNVCGETCSEINAFEEHQKTHASPQYLYVICDENFQNNGAKETVNVTEVKSDHMYIREGNGELAESNAISFCRMEEELVSNANDIEISLVKEQENTDYTCETCGKQFLQNAQYVKHKKVHKREKDCSLVCETCGRQFSRTSCLNDHKKIHTGERPYVCDTCGRRFAQSSILQRHKRIHSGEQPYVCPICGQKFTQSAGLHRHQRVHLGERHICDICHKGYTRKTGLILHRRLHTGEQPYACSKCEKRFTKNSYLQKHLQKYHIKTEIDL